MAEKRAAFDVRSLKFADNVPEGGAVSLAGIPPALGFAAVFRDELAARGFGLVQREEARHVADVD